MNDKIEFSGLNERLQGVPLLGGLLAGLLSFMVGYLSFLGIAAGTGDGINFDGRSLRQVGQFFHNSFLVPTHQQTKQVIENEAQGETVLQEMIFDVRYNPFYESDSVAIESRTYLDGTLFEQESRSIAAANANGFVLPELTFPDVVYLAIPVVALFAVGFVFAFLFISLNEVSKWQDVLTRGLIGGGTITLGFVLLALLGSYLFTIDEIAIFTAQTGEDVFTRPDRVDTLLFGLAYPAIWSTMGVLLGQLARRPSIEGTEQEESTVGADRAEIDGDEETATEAGAGQTTE